MTDDTPIVVNTDDDMYDEDDHDPETCDEIDCYYAPEFQVEITRTVRYKIHAHTEAAALEFVWAHDVLSATDPEGVDDWEDDGDEIGCTSEAERIADAARTRQIIAEMAAAEAVATVDHRGDLLHRWLRHDLACVASTTSEPDDSRCTCGLAETLAATLAVSP